MLWLNLRIAAFQVFSFFAFGFQNIYQQTAEKREEA